jgi:hypothetical protein
MSSIKVRRIFAEMAVVRNRQCRTSMTGSFVVAMKCAQEQRFVFLAKFATASSESLAVHSDPVHAYSCDTRNDDDADEDSYR